MQTGDAYHSLTTSIKHRSLKDVLLKDVQCEVRYAQRIRQVRDCRHAGSTYRVLGNETLYVHNNLQQHTSLR